MFGQCERIHNIKNAVFHSYLSFFIFPSPDRVLNERARAIFFNLFFSFHLYFFLCVVVVSGSKTILSRVLFSTFGNYHYGIVQCSLFRSLAYILCLFQCRQQNPVVLDCWVCFTCTVGATLTEWIAAAAPISRYQLIVDALMKQIFAFSFSAQRRSVIWLDAAGNNLLFNCIRCERRCKRKKNSLSFNFFRCSLRSIQLHSCVTVRCSARQGGVKECTNGVTIPLLF